MGRSASGTAVRGPATSGCRFAPANQQAPAAQRQQRHSGHKRPQRGYPQQQRTVLRRARCERKAIRVHCSRHRLLTSGLHQGGNAYLDRFRQARPCLDQIIQPGVILRQKRPIAHHWLIGAMRLGLIYQGFCGLCWRVRNAQMGVRFPSSPVGIKATIIALLAPSKLPGQHWPEQTNSGPIPPNYQLLMKLVEPCSPEKIDARCYFPLKVLPDTA